MTQENQILQKCLDTIEEICEHTRAIRRVVNRILDHLHEQDAKDQDYDPESINWEDLDNADDMFS